MSTIGERIANFHKKTGMSDSAFGEKIGISGTAVANIETGKTENPGVQVIHSIVREFGLNPEESYF